MDARHFDRLTRAWSEAGSRRGLLATLPVFGSLFALLDPSETDAKGRRKRHKKPHHHDRSLTARKKSKKKKHKKKCKPQSKTTTCANTCGSVKNNCKKTVDCGPCDCDPPCGVCQTCTDDLVCTPCDPCCDEVCCAQVNAICHASTGACCVPDTKAQTCADTCGDVVNNCGVTVDCGGCLCNGGCPVCQVCDAETGDCVLDQQQEGDACGAPGQLCQADGSCACVASSCGSCETCGGDGRCSDPCDATGCCASGTCEPGTADGACGSGGGGCVPCSGANPTCGAQSPGVCGCTPITTCPQQLNCGEIDNGCGGTLTCGTCTGVNTCGGGGAPNVCGCTPITTCPGGQNCGSISDGCGGTISCGGPCSNPTPICVNKVCTVCSGSHPCPSGCCSGGSCVATCPTCQTCSGGVCVPVCPVCETCSGAVCVADASQNGNVCAGSGATTSVCCNGACCDGCCGDDGSCGTCLAFVSSILHNGNLGGLSGADQICQNLADNAPTPLPGSYKAWLSIGTAPQESPATGRFRQSRQPYTLVDGTTVADDWPGLISGSINAPLNVNELGNAVRATDIVWTNTLPDGTSGGRESFQACGDSSFSHNCEGWTTTSSLELGDLGLVGAPNCSWTAHSKSGCFTDASRHLYCFQQD